MYTLNFVIDGTRIIIIIIIIVVVVVVVVLQQHNAEQKARQGKRYAAEKAGAAPKRTKEQSVFF
jgi:Flp pilus assembly protein CpaB